MKLIKRFFRFIDKKIIVPITKFFVSIGEKLKLSDKPLEKALSKKSSMIILSLVLAVIVFVIIDRQNTTLLEKNAEVLYDIPLSATYNDEEYVVEGLPETVDITLIGTKANLYLAKQLPTQDVNVDLSDLKPGVTFQMDGNLFVVLDYSHNKTARAAANIKVKMKNLRTGSTTEMTFGGNDKVKRAQIDKKEMQYLYNTGDAFVFMDGETYEQIEIPAENLEWEKNFLKESDTATIRSFEGEVLGVQLPDKVTLQITEAEQAVKGDTATGATKNAVLETGFQIKVPLFINEGEMVVISTAEGKYSGRA